MLSPQDTAKVNAITDAVDALVKALKFYTLDKRQIPLSRAQATEHGGAKRFELTVNDEGHRHRITIVIAHSSSEILDELYYRRLSRVAGGHGLSLGENRVSTTRHLDTACLNFTLPK